ncbi:nuclear transport factor 2 family protein [Kordia jejudonensis]|uniref:nuclear transport factor 2 family protein n=1 Tax=Kordia jejudonensis TaxID=1348245 RepID=UPI0006297478|nr:nuclear transport factor 2 family protein [Kordia jejudonensis]
MKKLLLIVMLCVSFANAQESNEINIIAQKQMETYNDRDIKAYASLFSDDIKVYDFPKKLRYEGKSKLIEYYGEFFKKTPELFSFIEKRIVTDNKIIDQEKVIYEKGGTAKEYVVMYVVENKKITEVYYIKR